MKISRIRRAERAKLYRQKIKQENPELYKQNLAKECERQRLRRERLKDDPHYRTWKRLQDWKFLQKKKSGATNLTNEEYAKKYL